MEVAKTVLLIVQIIVALFLIVTVLLQHGNSYGLSGSIAGINKCLKLLAAVAVEAV